MNPDTLSNLSEGKSALLLRMIMERLKHTIGLIGASLLEVLEIPITYSMTKLDVTRLVLGAASKVISESGQAEEG